MSLFKKRERFDRTDVPTPSPRRNVAGVVVILAVFALLGLTVKVVWDRVQLEAHLSDSDLVDACDATSNYTAPTGYASSTDEFDRVLMLTVDTLDEGSQLTQAQILVVNTTQNLGYLVNVPIDGKAIYNDEQMSLKDCYAQYGVVGAASGLSLGNCMGYSSMIVSTGVSVDQIAALAGTSDVDFVSSNKELLGQLKTSLDSDGLVALANEVAGIGVANFTPVDTPVFSEATVTDENGATVGAGYYPQDGYSLMVMVGIWYYA